MPRTLVVYHSRTGYTRRVARMLANRLGADLDEIRIVEPLGGPLGYLLCAIEAIAGLAPALRPPRKDPAAYDLIVVGTPVWFWSPASPVRSWLEQHRLRGKRLAFFCTMGGSGASRVFASLQELAGTAPVAAVALADIEIDRGALSKLEPFIETLRAGRRPRAAGAGTTAAALHTRPA